MKKIFLVVALCLTPILTSHAADMAEIDCINWNTYNETPTDDNYKPLHQLIKTLLTAQGNLKTWNNNEDIGEIKKNGEWIVNTTITKKCSQLPEKDTDQKQLFKNIELRIENELNKYKTIESLARMPKINHGNILPGPKEGVNGSDYINNQFIPKFINGVLIFIMSLSILMLIIGGLMFILSSGDSDLTTKAKTTITWAIVGVVLTILSYAIVRFIIGIDFSL
jgi:hypothetical protein